MATADEIRRKLRAETRDDHPDAPPGFMVMRGESYVGAVFWDETDKGWRCGRSASRTDSKPLQAPHHEQAIEECMDCLAAELADAES